MSNLNLFDLLVRYHVEENLARCRPYMADGVLVDEEGLPFQEGSDDLPSAHKGFLIVANGDKLAERLRKDRFISEDHDGFVYLDGKEDFFSYLSEQRGRDGAYVFNGARDSIVRVSELNNNPPSLEEDLDVYNYVPRDFVSFDGSVPPEGNLGTKTRIAIKFPHAFQNTSAYQLKRSAFGPTRMGKVTRFTRAGLEEEFFFTKQDFEGDEGIVGVHRRYARDETGLLMPVYEGVVPLEGDYVVSREAYATAEI